MSFKKLNVLNTWGYNSSSHYASPDVNSCRLPFVGAVVVSQNNMKNCPVEQRLHLNLQKR